MKRVAIIVAPLLLSVVLCGTLQAQNPRWYVRASVGVVQLETADWLSIESVVRPSAAIGYYLARSHAIELGWARFDVDADTVLDPSDGPIRALMRSTAVHLAYQYEPTILRVGRVQPFIALGAARTWVAHRTLSDVLSPGRIHSTANAFDVAAGLRATVAGGFQLVARAGYLRTAKVSTPITPTGAFGDIGLAFSW